MKIPEQVRRGMILNSDGSVPNQTVTLFYWKLLLPDQPFKPFVIRQIFGNEMFTEFVAFPVQVVCRASEGEVERTIWIKKKARIDCRKITVQKTENIDRQFYTSESF
jgi:hypothetical protein